MTSGQIKYAIGFLPNLFHQIAVFHQILREWRQHLLPLSAQAANQNRIKIGNGVLLVDTTLMLMKNSTNFYDYLQKCRKFSDVVFHLLARCSPHKFGRCTCFVHRFAKYFPILLTPPRTDSALRKSVRAVRSVGE